MSGTPWRAARSIAADVPAPRPIRISVTAATGTVLADPVVAPADLPPEPSAGHDGWAVCGIGPWRQLARHVEALDDGQALPVGAGDHLPAGTWAVLPRQLGALEATAGAPLVLVADPTTGRPAPRPGLIPADAGILDPGSAARAGQVLVPAGTVVSSATLALAAAAGVDEVSVVPPATVAVVQLGSAMLAAGPPRRHRHRDVTGPLVPSWVIGAGGRCLPPLSPDPADAIAVAAAIDELGADCTVLTATGTAGIDPVVPVVLQRLRGRVLVRELLAHPGGPVLLAALPDGRRILALPRQPAAALVACAALLTPMVRALGGHQVDAGPDVMLSADVPGTGERAVPIRIHVGELADWGDPLPWHGPDGLGAFAHADAIAFVNDDTSLRGATVRALRLPGRLDA